MSPAPREQVFYCQGVPVRMAARRDNGKVLVEYLTPRSLAPLAQWRECYAHELKAGGVSIGHIKSLAVVLPLARFASDEKAAVTASERPPGEAQDQRDFWWKK